MKDRIAERVLAEAKYILDTGATVRLCAKQSGVGKTTVHKDMRERLPQLDAGLAKRIGRILDVNRNERHLRGGEATKRKFRQEHEGGARCAPPSRGGRPSPSDSP